MKPQNSPLQNSIKSVSGSPTKLVFYLGWLVAFCLALMLLWVVGLYLTVKTERTVLLQQQELSNATLRSMKNYPLVLLST